MKRNEIKKKLEREILKKRSFFFKKKKEKEGRNRIIYMN